MTKKTPPSDLEKMQTLHEMLVFEKKQLKEEKRRKQTIKNT